MTTKSRVAAARSAQTTRRATSAAAVNRSGVEEAAGRGQSPRSGSAAGRTPTQTHETAAGFRACAGGDSVAQEAVR